MPFDFTVTVPGAGIPDTPGVTADISILNRSTLGIAPEALAFEINNLVGFDTSGPTGGNVYDPQLHDLKYFWNYDDTGNFSAPVNLVDGHKNANISFGPTGGHAFRSDGTYEVTCLIVEPSSGKRTTARTTITINPVGSTFSGTNTIYLDSSGVGTNAPVGANVVTTWAAAMSASLGSGQQANPKRVIIRAGEVLTGSGGTYSGSVPSTHIIGEAGTTPEITLSGETSINNITGSAGIDLTVQGVVFKGGWNVTTETGSRHNWFVMTDSSPGYALLDACEIVDFGIPIRSQNNGTNAAALYYVNDCYVSGWAEYGALVNHGRTFFTGNRITQDPEALSGGPQDNTHNEQGPFRIANPDICHFHSNDLFSCNSWSGSSPRYDTYSCFKFNTNNNSGPYLNCQANAMEGGFYVAQMQRASPTNGDCNPCNVIFSKNLAASCHLSTALMQLGFGGATIENNILINANSTRVTDISRNMATFVTLDQQGSNAENIAAPITVQGNTVVNNLSDANARNGTSPAITKLSNSTSNPFSNVSAGNWLEHQPNLSSPITTDGPVVSTTLFAPRYSKYELGGGVYARTTVVANPADTFSLFRPAAGAGADGGGDANAPYDDFFGVPREGTKSRGALEP